MDKDNNFSVPYIAYESSEAKHERTVRRLIIALIITIVLMAATNALWIYEFCSYDYVMADEMTTVEAGSGIANYIGQDGDITNGKDNSEEDTQVKN